MVTTITDLSHPAVAPYCSLTEAQLADRLHSECGIFIAESPKVIRVALQAGYRPLSVLCEARHITGDAADIIAACPDIPIYTGSRELLASITGYTLTRGVLCAMRRPRPRSIPEICAGASRIVVIDGVSDTTNIGSIFRSAAALNIDAVILTHTSCDPLNRRAVRVSMGTVFLVPWVREEKPAPGESRNAAERLHHLLPDFKTVAMALTDKSVDIDDAALCAEPRLAIIMGTEGDGLAPEVIAASDYTARIPMYRHVDSLNVAAAAAIAFWQLRRH